MTWSPISKRELTELMTKGLAEADDSVREAWERILGHLEQSLRSANHGSLAARKVIHRREGISI